MTLASALTKPHSKDTEVSILAFNQIEFSWSATLAGAKTVLATLSIDPEQDEMMYEDTTHTSGYYFTRYYNTLTTTYSDYSDGIPYSGLPTNTVGYAVDMAMNELAQPFTERLTFAMVIGFAQDMLSLVRGKLITWNKYREFEQDFGTVSQGVRRIALPAAVYDQNSSKSIKNLRVADGPSLAPVSRDEYLRMTEDATYTEVATQAAIADTSLVLDDTDDLDDTGTVYAYKSGVRYTIEYTANNRSTNTLTVSATQITVILPVDTPIWQGVQEGTPSHFSVWDGFVYFYPMISEQYEGRSLIGDYLTDIESIDSQMDVISGNYFAMLKPYLRFRIRGVVENNGKEDINDPSYIQFRELLQDAVKTNHWKFIPPSLHDVE